MSDLKIVMRRQHALNHSTVSDVQSSEPATATHVHPSCQRSSQPALHAPSLAEPHSAHPSHEKKESPTPQWPSNTTVYPRPEHASHCVVALFFLLYRSNCTGRRRACTAPISSDQHQCSFFPFCLVSSHAVRRWSKCSTPHLHLCIAAQRAREGLYGTGLRKYWHVQ